MSRARLEAFSDGVFAVAITLLALNLTIAGPGHGPLVTQLSDRWPSFVAYLVSFFVIGIIWVNHHALVHVINGVDCTLMFINLVLLLFCVLIPFATATMSDYLTRGDSDAHVAMALYAGVCEGMGLSFAALFEWSLGEGRRHNPVAPEERLALRVRFSMGSVAYLIAIGLSFVSAPLALGVIGAMDLYYIFEHTSSSRDAVH